MPSNLLRALVLRGLGVWFFARVMAIAVLSSADVVDSVPALLLETLLLAV